MPEYNLGPGAGEAGDVDRGDRDVLSAATPFDQRVCQRRTRREIVRAKRFMGACAKGSSMST
eukprot:521345-Pyramimonas_sp.AAC.1